MTTKAAGRKRLSMHERLVQLGAAYVLTRHQARSAHAESLAARRELKQEQERTTK